MIISERQRESKWGNPSSGKFHVENLLFLISRYDSLKNYYRHIKRMKENRNLPYSWCPQLEPTIRNLNTSKLKYDIHSKGKLKYDIHSKGKGASAHMFLSMTKLSWEPLLVVCRLFLLCFPIKLCLRTSTISFHTGY